MKFILMIISLSFLVSCGQRFADHEEYFQGQWRRNDTVQANGKKLTRFATPFQMPNTLEVDASLVVTVPIDRSVSDCYYGRVLTMDGSKYLDFQYYEVVDCYENPKNRTLVDIIIKFNRTHGSQVVFDYL